MEGFTFSTFLDLYIGYYHIELTHSSSALCTIVLLWGKYKYLKLPMGLCNSHKIIQEQMGDIFADLKTVRGYIDDLLVITKGDWNDHLDNHNNTHRDHKV